MTASNREQPAIASGDRRPSAGFGRRAPAAMKNLVRIYLEKPELAGIVLLVILAAVFEARSGGVFLSTDNLRGILGFLPEVGLVAIGVTILMICGEFDLSVGSVFALTPMATSLMIIAGTPTPVAILLGLVDRGRGRLRERLHHAHFRHSELHHDARDAVHRALAHRRHFRRLSAAAADELNTSAFTQFVGPGGLFRISFLWFLGIAAAAAAMLSLTNFGNWIKRHRRQSRRRGRDGHSGAARSRCSASCSAPMLAGFAGIIQVLRLGSPLPSIGEGLELQAVAAAVIGGTALTGGVGTVLGAIVGALLIRVIDNGLVLTQVDANWFKFAIGVAHHLRGRRQLLAPPHRAAA